MQTSLFGTSTLNTVTDLFKRCSQEYLDDVQVFLSQSEQTISTTKNPNDRLVHFFIKQALTKAKDFKGIDIAQEI